MYQSLNITLRTSFHNPSKIQLINMINLICKSQPNSTVSVNYQIIDTIQPIQMCKISGRVPNMKLLDHLACVNYGDTEIDINTLLKKLA
jgi:hypothetical protein